VLQCLNLASYNYLGFAASLVSGSSRHVSQQDNQLDQGRGVGCGDDDGQTKVSVAAIEGQCDAQDVSSTTATKTPSDNERCLLSAIETVRRFGVSASGSRTDAGTLAVHHKVEQMIAHFVGKEAAIVFNMGYATNSTCIPALVSEGDLIVSDSLNHASIVVGCRASGAKIKVFQHDNCVDLERILRRAILKGQSRTRRPYGKILIIVEGVYSMEGEICRLREIVALKRKYNCFLYVDEAHSIGAIGETGRGVCEHTGVDPADVDLLMGTFTKAFASVGGYIAANRDIVDHLRRTSSSYVYDTAMSPATAQQVISALEVLQTESGRARVASLRQNSILFRSELKARGFHVFGDESSPVVPVMLYYPCKMPAFSRASLQRRIAAVVVGYPATSFLSSRIRFASLSIYISFLIGV
jgi:serine palmitoyltransferase